jgi:protocatechuate 3,4-dioxygenase beta subunit
MFWEGHAMLQEQVADAEGRVRFDGVPVGRFRLEAQARGFARAVLDAIEVREAPGDAAFELRLAAGRALRGRVVDADRRPVADAEIHLLHLGEGAAFWGDHVPAVPEEEPDARSGPDGGFTLRGLPDPTAQLMVLAKAEGYGVGHLTRPEPDLEATLVLPPALAVSGRVLGGGDQPVAGAEVYLTRRTDWGWDETVASAETAADGTFQLGGVEPGSVTLSASAQGATSEPLPLDLQRPLADLTLRVAPRPALRVRVVGDAGQPLSGAIVDLSSAAQLPIETAQIEGVQIAHGFHGGWSGPERTGADGVATFHGAPEGELTISAGRPRCWCASWTAPARQCAASACGCAIRQRARRRRSGRAMRSAARCGPTWPRGPARSCTEREIRCTPSATPATWSSPLTAANSRRLRLPPARPSP